MNRAVIGVAWDLSPAWKSNLGARQKEARTNRAITSGDNGLSHPIADSLNQLSVASLLLLDCVIAVWLNTHRKVGAAGNADAPHIARSIIRFLLFDEMAQGGVGALNTSVELTLIVMRMRPPYGA